jgi:hypothetical protein
MVGHVVRKMDARGPRLRVDAHLQGRQISPQRRLVHRQPVPLLEFEEHRRIAAGGDDPSRRRLVPELEAPEQLRSLRIFDAILAVEDVGGPAVGTANGTPIRERFDLSGTFLAALAVAGDAHNGSADRFEFDASACAPGSLASSRWLSHPLLLCLSS